MKPTREQILSTLCGMRRAGQLLGDGPTSLFLARQPGAKRSQATQLVVEMSGDQVLVKTSRLPFAKPLIFLRDELDAVTEKAEEQF